MRRTAAALLLAVALATPAEPQELSAGLSRYGPFGIDDLDGEVPLSADFRVTVPLSDRFALEPFVSMGSRSHGRPARSEGFYGANIRQQIVRFAGNDGLLFATYGVAAYYYGVDSSPPYIGHLGFGLRHRVSSHLAVRSEVQLVTFHIVPIGARLVVGFSTDLR